MVDGPCSLLVFFALVFFLGMPVAFSFFTVNLICLYIWAGGLPAFALIGGSIFSTLNQFVLVPIPFFILMGDVLAISGVAWIIIEALDKWIGKVPGRLSLSAIAAGTIFAAVSGVSMGTTAMLGKVFYPEMRKRGYDKAIQHRSDHGRGKSCPHHSADGHRRPVGGHRAGVGGKTPDRHRHPRGSSWPSSTRFIFSSRSSATLTLAPPYVAEPLSLREKMGTMRHILPVGIIIFLVTGVIFIGAATPSEAAALGTLGSVLLVACYGRLRWDVIKKTLASSTKISVMVLMIIAGSTTFSQILAITGAAKELVNFAIGLQVSPLLLSDVYAADHPVLGCFMDLISIVMISIPIFMPVVNALGFDPVWFCTLTLINLGLGTITPPVGMLLFTLKGILPVDVTMGDIIRSSIPYFLIGILCHGVSSSSFLASRCGCPISCSDIDCRSDLCRILKRLLFSNPLRQSLPFDRGSDQTTHLRQPLSGQR